MHAPVVVVKLVKEAKTAALSFPDASPVLFSAIKHHQGYLQQLIRETSPDIAPQALRRLLLPIGAAQFDFYTGPLSVEALDREVYQALQQQELLSEELFTKWVQQHQGYRLISLSDQSSWTLRLGQRPNKWVHLHPARYSPHTCRLKAQALKTAISLLIKEREQSAAGALNLEVVNRTRDYLGLPPLSQRQLTESRLESVIQLLL